MLGGDRWAASEFFLFLLGFYLPRVPALLRLLFELDELLLELLLLPVRVLEELVPLLRLLLEPLTLLLELPLRPELLFPLGRSLLFGRLTLLLPLRPLLEPLGRLLLFGRLTLLLLPVRPLLLRLPEGLFGLTLLFEPPLLGAGGLLLLPLLPLL